MKPVCEIVNPTTERPKPRRRILGLGRKRLGQVLLAAFIALAGLTAWATWYFRADEAYNMHNLVRLHVVANSDKPGDQEVKLAVRDAILRTSGDLFSARAPDDAVAVVKANLPLFERVAENVLRANGYDYPVNVEFGTFAFPERTYGPLVLPAGDYQALRVVLGEGRGANWWCILFPPLCYLDVVGGRETEWGVTPGGTLAARPGATDKAGGATRVVSLDSLTPSQARDLERILTEALESVKDGKAASASGRGLSKGPGDEGVRVIISDIPASRDSDLVILVADTGTNRTEVRFYVFDRLRDLLRSLAEAAPWLVGTWSRTGPEAPTPDR